MTGVENIGGIIPHAPQIVTYNAFGKVSHIESGGYTLEIDYGSDRQRWRSTVTDSLDNIVRSIRYCEDEELVTMGDSTLVVLYFDGGIVYVREKNAPQSSSRFYQITDDRLGSVLNLVDGTGNKLFSQSYDAWGKPYNWNYGWFTHGYTGHEMLPEFGLINMNGRVYDPVLGRFLSPDDYVQMPLSPQGFNRYTYCNNNPLKYTDPSGEIFTWKLGKSGFSFGFNFTPFGIPLGFGFNVGYADGSSFGGYVEVGYRVGGTGFGSGITLSQSFDYNVGHSSWTTTSSENVYGSLSAFNAGGDISQTYNFTNHKWTNGWNASVGVGFGNEQLGFGLNIGYGSGGWTYGIGGYYDSHAWDDNPTFEPEMWNDDGFIQDNNNCYSYALDDKGWSFTHKSLNPGGISYPTFIPSIDYVKNAALGDGRIKEPSFINKLGFGKKGYYPVYLVLGRNEIRSDYHWYRQDNNGRWSHKRGFTEVINTDASGRLITNPAKTSHNYVNSSDPSQSINYNEGSILLWVRKK